MQITDNAGKSVGHAGLFLHGTAHSTDSATEIGLLNTSEMCLRIEVQYRKR